MYGDLAHRYISRAACAAEGVGARVVVGAQSLVDHWVVGGASPSEGCLTVLGRFEQMARSPSAGVSRVQVIFQEALVVMIPFKTKVARATGPTGPTSWWRSSRPLLAAPAGAQLQEALTAQAQVDRAAAAVARANQRDPRADPGRRRPLRPGDGRCGKPRALQRSAPRAGAVAREEIASIEQQLLDIETTNREVQPLMQQMVDTLARFVELDVPFLLDERTARVQNLQEHDVARRHHDLGEIPSDPRGLSDRARVRPHAEKRTKAGSARAPTRARSSSADSGASR